MAEANNQPGKISNFQLQISYWYVTHKLQLRRALVIFLIILSAGFYSYSIYKAVDILIIQGPSFQRDLNFLTTNLVDYSYYRQANKPDNIQIAEFSAVGGHEGKYDFVAKLKNPNSDFTARQVLVQLLAGGQVVAEKTTFVYPNEEKYVGIFGQQIAGGGNPVIKIARIDWFRVNKFEELSQPKLRFEISEIEFKSARDSGVRGDLPVSTLDFKIKNDTAYNYWRVGVYMVLFGADRIVGANYMALDQFLAGETRELQMRWYESLPSVTRVEILPEVDILNPDSFMPVQSR